MCIVASTLRKYSHAKILAQNFNSSGLIRIHRSRMCQPDIIRCIGIASTAMHSMNKVWRQTRLQLQTKLRLYQSCILSILLYDSETWTLLQEDLRKLEAFDMRCRRMILGIRWHDFVRNTEVVDRTNLPSVRDVIANRRNSLFGYVVRLDDHTPAHRALSQVAAARTGHRFGPGWRRQPGRPRHSWIQQIDRRRYTLQHSCWMVEGSSSWPLRVDATDICCLRNLMMMMVMMFTHGPMCVCITSFSAEKNAN